MVAVVADSLAVRYGDTVAVRDVSLEVAPGELVALLGPNGAGKTSTVETLEGYRRPSAGRVRVLGLDPVADRRRLAPQVGVMLQRGGVWSTMPAGRALRLFASYHERPLDPAGLLDQLGLAAAARTPWRRLSGGEQQRLSLAIALVGRPRVLFLDEPTAGVDPAGRAAIRALLADRRDDGVAVLLTTHELEQAERLADRVVIVHRGAVVAAGPPAELARTGGSAGIRFRAAPGLRLGAVGPVREVEPGEYVVALDPTAANLSAVMARLVEREVDVSDVRAGGGLEDLFLRLTGGDGGSP